MAQRYVREWTVVGRILEADVDWRSANGAALVYIVGVHRAVPGHREQLYSSRSAGGFGHSSKVQVGTVLLQHLEGSEWTFATITRYNSWQDVATKRAAAA